MKAFYLPFALLPMFAVSSGSGQVQPHKQVVQAARPPASVLPTLRTRQSTALAAAARSNPPQRKELPAFSLVNAEGKPAESTSIAQKKRWLLLYRRAVCAPCDRLMGSLAQNASFHHGAAITVVVADGAPDALARTQAQFSQWSEATWMADPKSEAIRALKMSGTPMLYGMNGTAIVFTLAGAPGGPEQVSTAAGSWVAQTADTAGETQ